MRKFASVWLIAALMASGAPSVVFGAAQSSASVTGVARGPNLQPLRNVHVQIRNTATGEIAGTTMTSEAGEFSVPGLPGGNYVIEVLDSANRMLGISTPFSVAPGSAASASVMALAPGTASVAGHGFSLFGLGPVTSMTVLGAASAAAVTAVVSTRPDASPSR